MAKKKGARKKTAKKKAAKGGRKRASVKAQKAASKTMTRGIFKGEGCE